MTDFDFSHIRPKGGESLSDYFTRVVDEWACSERGGGLARIRYALHLMQGMAEENGSIEANRLAAERRTKDLGSARSRIAELETQLRHSVSKVEAEEGRRKAAFGMRERAASEMESPRGVPCEASEAIRALPLPRSLWTETRRPGDVLN
ncbi:hypothetical protein EOA32_21395 [Mesorhizobium sp. M1A.F.Ca.ET.072.01.1.1]|uniref:hypothetical protein n=1 Tax=Mesorhizobium sp. M1A.F.Ca.ET.072.01.1.1 TaxID=2496753 RepID=UPI000FD36818|nr:hypothetical protein [Mesorhizobium sp. M1A.F.Ca.ET.072.01.1.1]RUW49789.1 hypothetical protein EOA32_21395 [Mesorhizobium sp. M1A.F.Ca.ET.072.01.1.1]TIV02915.1 MAG: hypothetical protein E5W04_10970 [Mesorhizobium sp.]